MPEMRLGIDLGGSKIELIAFDAAGHECLRERIPTPRNDYRAALEANRELIAQSERELGASGSVGIHTPDSLSCATGRLRNSNSVWWIRVSPKTSAVIPAAFAAPPGYGTLREFELARRAGTIPLQCGATPAPRSQRITLNDAGIGAIANPEQRRTRHHTGR